MKIKKSILCLAVTGLIGFAFTPVARADGWRDRVEDRREIRHDRRELRADRYDGRFWAARRERAELRADHRDLRHDRWDHSSR